MSVTTCFLRWNPHSLYNKWIDLYGDDFFPGPVQAIDRMKNDIVAMRGVVSAVKKSIGEAQALL